MSCMSGVEASLSPPSPTASASSRVTNRVFVCPYALNKLKRQELLDLCTLHTPNMSTVENDMLSNLTVPGLLNYLHKLDEELCQRKIKRVLPALSKMERQELLDLCTLFTPNMSTVEIDMLNKLTAPGLLNYLFKLDEELYWKRINSDSSGSPKPMRPMRQVNFKPSNDEPDSEPSSQGCRDEPLEQNRPKSEQAIVPRLAGPTMPTTRTAPASRATPADQAAPSSSAVPTADPRARVCTLPKKDDPHSFQLRGKGSLVRRLPGWGKRASAND